MKQKPLLIAILWYVGAIFFFIAAGIGKNMPYVAVGALYLCVGSYYLMLHDRHKRLNDGGNRRS